MHTRCLITPLGALIQVSVTPSAARFHALQAAKKPVPAAIPATLLIDTGASCTSVDNGIIARLGLTPTGTIPVHTPSTGGQPVAQDVYDVGLGIGCITPQGRGPVFHIMPNLPIVAAAFSAQGIDGLLGRDVLAQCRMTYSGIDGDVFLSF